MDHKKHIELAGTVTVGPKGQVVIPVEVRDKMGLEPGDKLVALYIAHKQCIGFVAESQLQGMIDKWGDQLEVIRSRFNDNK